MFSKTLVIFLLDTAVTQIRDYSEVIRCSVPGESRVLTHSSQASFFLAFAFVLSLNIGSVYQSTNLRYTVYYIPVEITFEH